MDYEKKYKEALERARAINNGETTGALGETVCEFIFPELKESKNEKIRKAILALVKQSSEVLDKQNQNNMIAWLEKQGEKPQGKSALEAINEEKVDNANKVEPKDYSSIDPHFFKTTDKVEPRFHEGEWITDGYLHCKITQVLDDRYIVDTKFGKRSAIFFKRENNYHLWSIQDARDGDILAGSKDEVILIFRGIGNTEWNDVIDYHCYYDCYRKEFIKQKVLNFWGYVDNNNLKPATKKQRDLLFSKMKEAGWEWDSKKKELRKGE